MGKFPLIIAPGQKKQGITLSMPHSWHHHQGNDDCRYCRFAGEDGYE